MNIIFLCRWKLEDGLTIATVVPHLNNLTELRCVRKIIFITLEDVIDEPVNSKMNSMLNHPKIQWLPFITSKYKSKIVNQITDYRIGYNELKQVIANYNIDLTFAHGAPAGALALKVWEKTKVPFYVSLFEPHAEYMAESGVWSRYGLKYSYQKKWEQDLIKTAKGLMPVAESYTEKLLESGVSPEKVFTVPCSVDTEAFRFCNEDRTRIRKRLEFENSTVGIYVGKFGGLYYNEEAFILYQQCFLTVPHFRLIILSPQPKEEILQQLKRYKIDLHKVYVASVSHEQVPAYLSAADFAFATYKPGPSKRYLSPVKVGEYWANGLPVLLTEGVGDDSDIIKKEGGGAVFNLQQEGSLSLALQQIQEIVKDPLNRLKIPELAMKYRSPDKIKAAYQYFLGKEEGGQ